MDINKERKALLKSASPEVLTKTKDSEMRELVDLLRDKYTIDESLVNLEEATRDMGLILETRDGEPAIEKTAESEVTVYLPSEGISSPEVYNSLIRLLGMYLLTDSVGSANTTVYAKDKLGNEDEHLLQKFRVLMSVPDLEFNSRLSMAELVKISIEKNIPLPVLRDVMSI